MNKKIHFKFDSIPRILLTCFALHTFCEEKNVVDESLFQTQQLFHRNIQNNQENLPDKIYSGVTTDGIYVRNLLTEYISQSLSDLIALQLKT